MAHDYIIETLRRHAKKDANAPPLVLGPEQSARIVAELGKVPVVMTLTPDDIELARQASMSGFNAPQEILTRLCYILRLVADGASSS